jgi:hypothetical protein
MSVLVLARPHRARNHGFRVGAGFEESIDRFRLIDEPIFLEDINRIPLTPKSHKYFKQIHFQFLTRTTSPGRYAGQDNGWVLALIEPVILDFDKTLIQFPNIKRFSLWVGLLHKPIGRLQD